MEYSLEHLSEFEHEYVQAATDSKPERVFRFVIEFGLHCFTKAPNSHKREVLADYDQALHYRDSREVRVFCFDRYEKSSLLPDIARGVSTRACYRTGKGNFFTIELVGADQRREEYEIYFKVSRTNRRGLLRLFIDSAYVRDCDHGSSQPKKKKIGFFVIAHNVQQKKPVPR